MEEIVMALKTRGDLFNYYTDIDSTKIYKTSRLVSDLTGMFVQPNKAVVGTNAFRHASGIHQDGLIKERTTYEVMDPESIRIKASTDSFESADTIKQRIEDTGYFGGVQVKDVKTAPDGSGVDFRLTVFFNRDGAGAPALR